MDLRGFSKGKTRTWYTARKFSTQDALALIVSGLIFIATVSVSIFVNKSRFYNPFI
jgi:energy-coupling factor transport system permease protein